MTEGTFQILWMVALTVVNLVWFLGSWRGRSDRVEEDLPALKTRVSDLEEFMHEARGDQAQIAEIKARMEVVATRAHEAINRMNSLPETLSPVFLRKDIADIVIREAATDRERLHGRLDQLSADIGSLRRYINTRKDPRNGPA